MRNHISEQIPEGVVMAMAMACGPDSPWYEVWEQSQLLIDKEYIFWQEGKEIQLILVNEGVVYGYR